MRPIPVLLPLLVSLMACAHSEPPFRCSDYADPQLQLQCQAMVLGAYTSMSNNLYGRWNDAFRVEPPAPLATAPLQPVLRPQFQCQTIGGYTTCQ